MEKRVAGKLKIAVKKWQKGSGGNVPSWKRNKGKERKVGKRVALRRVVVIFESFVVYIYDSPHATRTATYYASFKTLTNVHIYDTNDGFHV